MTTETAPAPAPTQKKSMTEGQKERLRGLLDEMKSGKCDCLVCVQAQEGKLLPVAPNKAKEFFATPNLSPGRIEIQLYGICSQHARRANGDDQAATAVRKLRPLLKSEKPKKPLLMVVAYQGDDEEVSYA